METTKFDLIRINHNHGTLVLKDAELIPYEYTNTFGTHQCNEVRGTVVSGGVTNRLFHATSSTEFPKGEQMSWDLYGRTPYPLNEEKTEWYVDCGTCG